jgi:hypothetical protein
MIPSWLKKVISKIFVLHWSRHAVLSHSDDNVFHCNDGVQFQGQNGMPPIHQGQRFQRNSCLLLPKWFKSEATDRWCSCCLNFSSCRILCWHICHAQIFGLICPSWAEGFLISQNYEHPLRLQHFCLMKYVQNALRPLRDVCPSLKWWNHSKTCIRVMAPSQKALQ